MSMKPWREVIQPHPDVLEGTFQQSEFAADISAVHKGEAGKEYGDAVAFFDRTYITDGMAALLTQVAQRLTGVNGDPVVQLQTAFGGGKTHTMLAVYHLASREVSLKELQGISALIDKAGITDLPKAKVAVLDGLAFSPGSPWKNGKQEVKTLWGELACQLGGAEGYALVKNADLTGTSPGKDTLVQLLKQFSPCIILIDELVAYVRQLTDDGGLSGGTFDSNLSFVQALTEAVKQVKNAMVIASLPESEVEAGSDRGVKALKTLEKTFGRVQALWKPVGIEESFEIVRRRLFETVKSPKNRDEVCKAFADAYKAHGDHFPTETQVANYEERLKKAYPIHPEVFDRLYEDWATIEGFQRTRGVLKMMAKVIHCLWKDNNKDLMIMPGGIPLYDGPTRQELTYLLGAGWDPVVDKDIDGDGAETTLLENREPRFGAFNAARRVARTIFLGSAPASVSTKSVNKGIDRNRVILGSFQPEEEQEPSLFSDALLRLADRLHYMGSSSDNNSQNALFWFDTRANLRREMEERKRSLDEQRDVRPKIAEVLKRVLSAQGFFDGVHVFAPHADIPDDSALRLVVLSPESFFVKEEKRIVQEDIQLYLRNHGTIPRSRANRLLFLAADQATNARLKESIKTALAWKSIVEDVRNDRLNIDNNGRRQAEQAQKAAEDGLPRIAKECFKWLLCPIQVSATDPKIEIEHYPLNAGASDFGSELKRVCCDENDLVISRWSPVHLKPLLQKFYWKSEKPYAVAKTFWEDTQKYLYLPRLRNIDVLENAIRSGASTREFFGTALAIDGEKYVGFQLGNAGIQLDDTLLLIDPIVAGAYDLKVQEEAAASKPSIPESPAITSGGGGSTTTTQTTSTTEATAQPVKEEKYHLSAPIKTSTARMELTNIATEIISNLALDPHAEIQVTIEVHAKFPKGASADIKRAINENSSHLKLPNSHWE